MIYENLFFNRILQILLHCSKDNDFEIALQSTMALSNIAVNINTHSKVLRWNFFSFGLHVMNQQKCLAVY